MISNAIYKKKGELRKMSLSTKITPQTLDQSIQTLIRSIDKGEELLQIDEEEKLSDQQKLEYNDCIILSPFYQREYRASSEDESLLIESVLVGIPIPPVFLATTRYLGVQVLDVVDGQHRLRAFYRFVKGEFHLKNLPLLPEYNDFCFEDLPYPQKEIISSHKLSSYIFRDFPGKKFELEIFNRYNKGTKSLTAQEIRNAVYSSPFNQIIRKFTKDLQENKNQRLSKAYNITKDRYLKQKVNESIFCILYILEFGLNESFKDSTTYAEEYMKLKADFFETDYAAAEANLEKQKEEFSNFNSWIEKLMEYVEYPFSREIYGVSSRNYKFQSSISMILAAIYKQTYIDSDELSEIDINVFMNVLRKELSNSYLEDPDYNASSTNSKKLVELITSFKRSIMEAL